VLLRDASLVRVEEGDGPKRRTSPVHAEQAGMCEERLETKREYTLPPLLSTRIHALPAQASSNRGLGELTRLRWGARMRECSAARRDTNP
jgi:hypothetical protein